MDDNIARGSRRAHHVAASEVEGAPERRRSRRQQQQQQQHRGQNQTYGHSHDQEQVTPTYSHPTPDHPFAQNASPPGLAAAAGVAPHPFRLHRSELGGLFFFLLFGFVLILHVTTIQCVCVFYEEVGCLSSHGFG